MTGWSRVAAAAVVAALVVFVGWRAFGGPGRDGDGEAGGRSGFEFGLIGDARYTPEQKSKFAYLMEEMNGEELAFTVHDGDIKGGGPCDDQVYLETRGLFDQFSHPVVYTPGDNEWTDCGPVGADPLERLAFLRRVFFPTEDSLGRRRLRLERQGPSYPEHARWTHGGVTFATLHVVGSNDNLPDARNRSGNAGEHAARTQANLDWLSATFRAAAANGSVAVLLAMQADPGFGRPLEERTGFELLLAVLERETLQFRKPVVLVHGDSHEFRIDKPMVAPASGRRVQNFTRVETFGPDDVHWVRGSVDPRDPEVFTFVQEIVEENVEP